RNARGTGTVFVGFGLRLPFFFPCQLLSGSQMHCRLCWLGRSLLGLSLLRLISLLFDSADLHAAFQEGSILYADPVGCHIARQRAFAADIQTVRALDVTLHLADNHNFAGTDVGGDATVTPNGDALTGKINGALDSAIDVQRLGTGYRPALQRGACAD